MEATTTSRAAFQLNEKSSRFDPEFVRGSTVALEDALRAIGARKIVDIADVNAGPNISQDDYADEKEVSYIDLDSVDIQDGLSFAKTIIFGERPSRAKHLLSNGDVLVGNVRPNRGNVTLALPRHQDAIASSGFTRVRIHSDSKISGEYLFAFLRCKFGREQLVRRARGSMYPAVLPRDVESVWIVEPDEKLLKSVTKEVRSVASKWQKFFALKEQADGMVAAFLSPFGIPPGLLETGRTGVDSQIINRTHCYGEDGAGRIDADFFRKEYADFAARVLSYSNTVPLGTFYRAIQGRISGDDSLHPTLRQAMLTNVGVNWSAITFEAGSNSVTRPQVVDGDVLLASMAHEAHYIGRRVDYIDRVPDQFRENNQVIHHLTILRRCEDVPLKDVPSGPYLAAFLRHPCGMHQVQRCNRGVRGDHVLSDDLEQHVLIPIPPKDWQAEFQKLSKSAERLRLAAKEKEQDTERSIDDWVNENRP